MHFFSSVQAANLIEPFPKRATMKEPSQSEHFFFPPFCNFIVSLILYLSFHRVALNLITKPLNLNKISTAFCILKDDTQRIIAYTVLYQIILLQSFFVLLLKCSLHKPMFKLFFLLLLFCCIFVLICPHNRCSHVPILFCLLLPIIS